MSLARAFWFWFVAGSLAFATLASLAVVALAEMSRTLTVGAGIVAALGTPLYLLGAGILVWRRGRDAPAAWRWISRLAVLAVLAFVALAYETFTGVHWDMRLRARVSEALAHANVARTALGVACSEGRLVAEMSHAALGIAEPAALASERLHRVEATVLDTHTVRVVTTLKAQGERSWLPWRGAVEDGSTVVYDGRCGADGLTWTVGGTVARHYRPRS